MSGRSRRRLKPWVESRVYRSADEKVEAVNAYLNSLESVPVRFKSLVSWDWIKRNVQGLSGHYAASSS